MTNIATASVRFGADGVDIILNDLRAREDRLADVSPAWPGVIAEAHAVFAEAWATEGASTEKGPWSPLAERTQQERARLGYGAAHPILEREGRAAGAEADVDDDGAPEGEDRGTTFMQRWKTAIGWID